jgi:hypothetical protein
MRQTRQDVHNEVWLRPVGSCDASRQSKSRLEHGQDGERGDGRDARVEKVLRTRHELSDTSDASNDSRRRLKISERRVEGQEGRSCRTTRQSGLNSQTDSQGPSGRRAGLRRTLKETRLLMKRVMGLRRQRRTNEVLISSKALKSWRGHADGGAEGRASKTKGLRPVGRAGEAQTTPPWKGRDKEFLPPRFHLRAR